MFLGTHTPRLDDKGRLFLPARFRERLASGLVLTRGQERCLFIYPTSEFERMTAAFHSTQTSNRAVRDYQRLLMSGASDEIPDRQGRITVPPLLRVWASLTHECTVIGAGTRIEVWDSAAWAAYLEQAEQAYAEQSEEVVPGLL